MTIKRGDYKSSLKLGIRYIVTYFLAPADRVHKSAGVGCASSMVRTQVISHVAEFLDLTPEESPIPKGMTILRE